MLYKYNTIVFIIIHDKKGTLYLKVKPLNHHIIYNKYIDQMILCLVLEFDV